MDSWVLSGLVHANSGPRTACVAQRSLVTYEHWFGLSTDQEGKPPMPQYLMRDLPRHVMRNMARFRLSCHGLAVETGRYTGVPWQVRCCDYCLPTRRVQDEHHVAFECEGTKFERCRYADLIRGAGGDMKALMSLDGSRVAHFISECVQTFDLFRADDDDVMFGDVDDSDYDGEQPV